MGLTMELLYIGMIAVLLVHCLKTRGKEYTARIFGIGYVMVPSSAGACTCGTPIFPFYPSASRIFTARASCSRDDGEQRR